MLSRNIEDIVRKFENTPSDARRYALLTVYLKGDARTADEMTWRAHLCTALEKAGVWPQTQPVRE